MWEDAAYAMKLLSAGIYADVDLYLGTPHDWEVVIPNSDAASLPCVYFAS